VFDLESSPPPRRDLDELLRRLLDPDATFRPQQREAVEAVLEEGARVLLVERTGWGKSAVYWLATRIWRDEGHGPTLIISPLLSLMRDQLRAAANLGLRAETVNTTNRDRWGRVLNALEADEVDVLLISPERLANDEFRSEYLPAIQRSMGLFVVDEVHCISDWGHDFRPDYRRIAAILKTLPPSVPVLGTTATANARVQDDVAEQLGSAARKIVGPLARGSLRLKTLKLDDQAERLAWLADYLPHLPGSGIVYCLTVADTERVAAWLQASGIDAHAYNGRMQAEERERLEAALRQNEVKALVATVALGMGYDKPDLGFVVHYQRPGSVISYYQQVGRAGRAVHDADGILLSGREDDDIQDYFIRMAFPPAEQMQQVLEALASVDAATIGFLETQLNIRHNRLEVILKLLEVDGAVARDRSRYFRTASPWQYDADRIEHVTHLREQEVEQMRDYMKHNDCLMLFLTSALDDPSSEPCGRCMNCRSTPLPSLVSETVVRQAIDFLQRSRRPIVPRLRWAPDAIEDLAGAIKPANEPGWALSIYGDAGWGRRVAEAKNETKSFGPDLVRAAAECIREQWQPSPSDGWWVTSVPSRRSTRLVADAASAIAQQLGLPYRDDVITKVIDAPSQKKMENSAMQLRNAHSSMGIVEMSLAGPVILVDDVVDSRWTLTVAGHLLRRHGSGPVYPFAFAVAAGGAS
jgi:ATP-dependent DNA helicase RecQ